MNPDIDCSIRFPLPTSGLGVPATTFKDKTTLTAPPGPIALWGLLAGGLEGQQTKTVDLLEGRGACLV